jgi:hypothetical protein
VREDFESIGLKNPPRTPGQISVLEYASAEYNITNFRSARNGEEPVGESIVKFRRYQSKSNTRSLVGLDAFHERGPVAYPVRSSDQVSLVRLGLSNGTLKTRGGLSFEEVLLRSASQIGHRVEESAYTRRLRGVDLVRQHCGELVLDLLASRGGTPHLPEKPGCGTGTIAHGGFASGKRERPKRGDPLEAVSI